MHEYPTKDTDHDPKGKKVLHTTMELDNEDRDDCLSEFCFMATKEEKEEDFERAFEERYVETIYMSKKNKELNEQLETINMEKGRAPREAQMQGIGAQTI